MPINLIAKIVPKNDGFIGLVDADQILGGDGSGTLPNASLAADNVIQFTASPSEGDTTHISTADQIYDFVINQVAGQNEFLELIDTPNSYASADINKILQVKDDLSGLEFTDNPTLAGATFTGAVTGVTPTAGNHFVIKEYLDLALGAHKTFFLSDTGSGVGALNYAYPRETNEVQSTIVNDGGGEAYSVGTHLHRGFITEVGEPATTTIHKGVMEIHFHAKKGAFNHRITTLHAVISRVDADGTSNKVAIVTSEVTAELTDTETDYHIHVAVTSDVEIAYTARLICDIYANVTTGALSSVVTLYMEGTEDSYFSAEVDSGIWQNHGDVLDDLNIVGQVGADSEFLVGTDAGVLAWESGATARTSLGVDAAGTASGLIGTHESTYNHGSYNTAYSHSLASSGNPHSVTPTELSLVIGSDVQAHGAGLDDLSALGAPASDGQFIVATGAGAFVYEKDNVARTSLGLGTDDSPVFTEITVDQGIINNSPSTPDAIATKGYVDSLGGGGSTFWTSVAVTTTEAIDLSTDLETGDVIDGWTLVTGDRVLVKDQSDATENGLYTVVASGAASRSSDADTAEEIISRKCIILHGDTYEDMLFFCASAPITLGVTNIEFNSLAGGGTYGIIELLGDEYAVGGEWASPVSVNDVDSKWTDENNTIDENLSSSGICVQTNPYATWLAPLIFTVPEAQCTKIRIRARDDHTGVYIRVRGHYYDGSWNVVSYVTIDEAETWYEIDLGGIRNITQFKIDCWKSQNLVDNVQLFEVEYWTLTSTAQHKITLEADTPTSDIVLTFPNTSGAANQALVTDGSGVLSWAGHDGLADFASNEHFLQTTITNVSTTLSTGLLKVTTGSGALSIVADSSGNWDNAYNWGDHAGLYDSAGTMTTHLGNFTHGDIATNKSHSDTTHNFAFISGNDGATDVTASELEELTNGSESSLHSHAGGGGGGGGGMFPTLELDYMEYDDDDLAQAAYVSSEVSTIDVGSSAIERGVSSTDYTLISAVNPVNSSGTITLIDVYMNAEGNIKIGAFYIVSGSTLKCRSVVDLGVLSVGFHSIPVSLTVVAGDYLGCFVADPAKVEFSVASGSTMYYAAGDKCVVNNQTAYSSVSPRALSFYGWTLSLQSYSEDTIKQQGAYSLKVFAEQTSSLTETLTRTFDPVINLSDRLEIKFSARASRTGNQFKVGIHDSGGTTTEYAVNIAEVDVWQEEIWDISGIANINKDAIDEIILTILNADVANTIYIDEIYTPSVSVAFLDLTDTPADYTGEAGNTIIVNGAEDGLEFGAAPGGGGGNTSRCSVYLSGDQSFTTGSSAQIEWDTEVYDDNDEFNTGTHTWTVKDDGYYTVSVNLTGKGNYVANRLFGIEIFIDDVAQGRNFIHSAYVAFISNSISKDYYLTVGQTIKVQFYQNSGSSYSIDSRLSRSWMSIRRFA